jgi:hypothetical protein
MTSSLGTTTCRRDAIRRVVEGGRPSRRGMAAGALRCCADVVDLGRGKAVAAVSMATGTTRHAGVIHGRRRPSGAYSMAAAAGRAGHGRHGMRLGTGCRTTGRSRAVVASRALIGRSDTCMRKRSRQPRGRQMAT